VVERESLEAATAFLQGRPDVDMGRIIFVITGSRAKARAPKTGYAQLAGKRPYLVMASEAISSPPSPASASKPAIRQCLSLKSQRENGLGLLACD
jgi:hypothetical protein